MNIIIIELEERGNISENVKNSRVYYQFQELLSELRKKELPHRIIEIVNQDIEEINSAPLSNYELKVFIKQKQTKILKLIEKELNIVPQNHYQNMWVGLGMCVFGLPLGVVYGLFMSNMAMLGLGLPVGLAIGVLLGAYLDKKAAKEGRQLDIKI